MPFDAAEMLSGLFSKLRAEPITGLTVPLCPTPDASAIDPTDSDTASHATDEPVDDSEPEVFGQDGWPLDSIDPDELDPCPKCGTLELWQTLTGNWRCLRCDPPTTARWLREWVTRLQSDRTDSPRADAKAGEHLRRERALQGRLGAFVAQNRRTESHIIAKDVPVDTATITGNNAGMDKTTFEKTERPATTCD